jgi:subtilisin family serine protease
MTQTDASERSPASAPEAVAVGATNQDDKTRTTSNYGKCETLKPEKLVVSYTYLHLGVDILAPGDKITSAGIEAHNQYVQKSGTSMGKITAPSTIATPWYLVKKNANIPLAASPHVAGVVCCLFSSTNSTQSPASVIQLLKKMAGRDEITLVKQKDTLNLMLNNGEHVQ